MKRNNKYNQKIIEINSQLNEREKKMLKEESKS